MLNQRAGLFTVSIAVVLVILTQVFAVAPATATAQCPPLVGEGATAGITNFNTAKSQMWFNDGVWWGVFSDQNVGIYFYSFPNDAATKGPIIDANLLGIPDVLWDGSNLYVMIWKSVSLATFYKFTYNSTTKTYPLVSGFPVQIPLNNSATSSVVINKDSTGKLWGTYTGTQGGLSDGTIKVIWTTSAAHTTWDTTGFNLETGLTPNTTEISTLVPFGGNKIGVAWSNQPGKQIGFRFHIDGSAENTWSTKELVDAGLGPRGLGPVADDHLAIKAGPDGRVFLIAKDNDNDGTPAHATEGRLWLHIRTAAGVWGQKTIIQPDFSQLPTRPVLLLDLANDNLYVIYHDESPSGAGRNFIAHSSMSNPSFDFPCVFNLISSSNPTSTKQDITTETGLMAVASTGSTGSGELLFRHVSLLAFNNPFPAIANVSPTSGVATGPGFTLSVNGSNYTSSSVVRWNGSDRVTTFITPNQVTAAITQADISSAGNASVTVFNPAPGGGESSSVSFTINNPVPTVSNISPATTTAGGPALTLTVNGTNFVNTSVIRFNGVDHPTTVVNSTQVTTLITAADILTAGSFPIAVFTPAPGGGLSNSINLQVNNNNLGPPKLEFTSANFSISESGGSALITVNRSGDTSGTASVAFAITDPIGAVSCSAITGGAAQNCDYTISAGTIQFLAGETVKSFTIPIVDDNYVEGNETLHLKLENATGAALGTNNTAVLTILDDDTTPPTTNPIDQAQTFVRQHYLDFLSREPDPGGLSYWSGQISQCGSDPICIHRHRNGVSGAFFVELEFQRTGSVVYRIHKATYGTNPSYGQFMPDRSQLVDGPQLPATTLDFANRFVLRPEFKAAYPDSMNASQFVNTLYDTALVMNNPTQRQQAIDALTNGTKSRAQVLLDLTEITEFKQREYNPSFVLMQYFGYLRRDPDPGGYEFWLDVINNREPNNYPSMICAFITSREYQQRFSSVVTRSNSQCGQ